MCKLVHTIAWQFWSNLLATAPQRVTAWWQKTIVVIAGFPKIKSCPVLGLRCPETNREYRSTGFVKVDLGTLISRHAVPTIQHTRTRRKENSKPPTYTELFFTFQYTAYRFSITW